MEQKPNPVPEPTPPPPSGNLGFEPSNIYADPTSVSIVGPRTPQPASPQPANVIQPQQGFTPAPESQPPAPANYASSTTPIYSGNLDGSSPKSKFGLGPAKFLVPGIVVLVLLAGSAAAYFGYVQPNQPVNMWNSALANTGKGYDKLTSYATNYDTTKGTTINGGFKVSGDVSADGSLSGASDGQNSDISGNVSAMGLKINYALKTIKSAGNTPDVYFKLDGLDGLGNLLGSGDPTLTQGINSLNGQWYFIDHSLFDQFAKGANASASFSTADSKSILNAIGNASKQYVFTKDKSKQAFTLNQQIGKEKQDGRSVYHYKVGINKPNLKSYVTTLCSNLKSSSLKKLFGGDEAQAQQAVGCDKAPADVDKMDTSGSADAWVDTHTKLIHKIRFSDKTNPSNYFDIGQDYQGGDSFPFELGFSDKTGADTANGKMTITINTKTNVFDVSGQGGSSGSSKSDVSFNLNVSPSNSKVAVTAPAGAKNLIQLLNDMGLGSILSGGGSAGTNAKDTERKTDVNALQGQLEAYYAENGYYPSYLQLNDPTWRHSHMGGLDDQALIDPDGGVAHLASVPVSAVYAYQQTPGGCDNAKFKCLGYTLTATLSDGTTYSKKDLNSPDYQSG